MPNKRGIVLGQSSLEQVILAKSVGTGCKSFGIFDIATILAPFAWAAMVPTLERI